MAQKSLTPEKVEELRSLRLEGHSVHEVAARAGVSEGAVSNYTRDIGKPARSTQAKKEAPPDRREGKDIMDLTAGAKLDTDTVDLANRVRKARLQAELDDIDNRAAAHQELDDMRLRERKLLLQLDETRLGASKGDSGVVADITQLRSELGELREARHQSELRQSEDRHQGEIRRLEGLVAGIQRTGLTEMDIMSRVLDKGENVAIMFADKVEKIVKSGQGDKTLMTALQLGLTPPEYALLLQGADEIPTREDWELGRRYRAHRAGVKLEEAEEGEYEGLVALIETRNRRWRAVMDKATLSMGRGGSQVVRTGKTGTVPAPGEPEPLVLKAESKLVQCQRCGSVFDVDLNEARRSVVEGTKLFVNCPKCAFLLDLKDLVPELAKPVEVKSATPECYVAGEGGKCVNPSKGLGEYQCQDCHWSGDAIRHLAYE